MANDVRKPRVGDHVAAIGHSGTFEVTGINEHGRTADLKLRHSDKLLTRVPWTALSYGTDEQQKKSREDVNQAAARIVREDTDK